MTLYTSETRNAVWEPLSGKMEWVDDCPFCGGKHLDIGKGATQGNTRVSCLNCGACGPNWDWSAERAIHSWNTRAA